MCCCDDDDGRRKSYKLGRRKSLFHSNIITNASDNNCHSTFWTNSLICVNHFQNKCIILSTCCFKNCFQTNLHHSMLVGLGANSLSNSNPSSRYLGNWTKKFCGMSPKPNLYLSAHFAKCIPNICEKCPSSIRRRDSNSQPSDYESPHLTTRPGLPPYEKYVWYAMFLRSE